MYSLVLMMALTPSADTPSGLFNRGCCGGYSCSGSSCCGGYSCSGCNGCHGAKHCIFGGRNNCHGGSNCHGCCGGNSCCGGGAACHGCTGGGCTGAAPAAPAPKAEPAPAPKPKEGAAMAAPATIVVSLPADAKLTIDGAATRSTSSVRTFVTPTLDAGNEFSYTLKAEVVRDGQTFSTEQRVTVRAGEESRINITVPTSASAQ